MPIGCDRRNVMYQLGSDVTETNSLKNKCCVITGATSGIGVETAKALVNAGANVTLVCRSESKGKALVAELSRGATNSIDLLIGDLSKLKEVRRVAAAYLATEKPLHILINNAGLQNASRKVTEDGFEETFAVNHLAHFLLTNLLLERIQASAPARIINVASAGYQMVKGIDFDDLNGERSFNGMKAYGASKLSNILFTRKLANQLKNAGVTVNCLHPGAVKTSMGEDIGGIGGLIWKIILATVAITPEQGAKTTVYLASSPDVENVTGKYFVKCAPQALKPWAMDDAAGEKLWRVSAKLVGLPAS